MEEVPVQFSLEVTFVSCTKAFDGIFVLFVKFQISVVNSISKSGPCECDTCSDLTFRTVGQK